MSSRQDAHLSDFLSICSLHCLFAVELLQGGYMLVWGPESVAECCQHSLSVMLAMVAQVPLSVTGMKPFCFPNATEVALT